MATKPKKPVCPDCGRHVARFANGTLRRHNTTAGVPCTPASNVVDIAGKRPPRPRKAAGMSRAELEDANATRPESKALDRNGYGACHARLSPKGGEPSTERCKQAKGHRTDHPGFGRCKVHGGTTPNGKKHAALEMARAELARVKGAMTFYGHRVVIDAEQALLEEMQRTAGAVRWLERAIAEWGEFERMTAEMDDLDPAADPEAEKKAAALIARMTRPLNTEDEGVRTFVSHADDRTGLPSLVAVHSTERAVGFTDTEYRAWLKVYQEERRHLAWCAKACIEANISERRQAVLEARADMIRSLVLIAFRLAGVKATEAQMLDMIAEATRTVVRELPA